MSRPAAVLAAARAPAARRLRPEAEAATLVSVVPVAATLRADGLAMAVPWGPVVASTVGRLAQAEPAASTVLRWQPVAWPWTVVLRVPAEPSSTLPLAAPVARRSTGPWMRPRTLP
jgi:hypothetical protein